MTKIHLIDLSRVSGGGRIPRLKWGTLAGGAGNIFTAERLKGGEQFLAKVVQDGKTYFTGDTRNGKHFVLDGAGELLYGKKWEKRD